MSECLWTEICACSCSCSCVAHSKQQVLIHSQGSFAAAACSAVHAASGSADFLAALHSSDRSEVWPTLCAEAYVAGFSRFAVFASPEQAASWADGWEWVEAFLDRNEKPPARSPDTSPSASNL